MTAHSRLHKLNPFSNYPHMHIRTRLLYTALMPLFFLSALNADEEGQATPETVDPGPFYGFWEFQEPAGDSSIVIIKRGGRLSCFWSGTRSQTIQKGTWKRTETHLTARWETGHVDVFEKLGDNAIERNSYEPGMSLLQEPVLTLRGVRVDSRIPGSLTVKSDGEATTDEADIPAPRDAPAIPMRNAFIGYWKMDQSTGIFGIGGAEPHFYLRLARSGDASVALRDWEGDQAVVGKWKIDGDRVIVSWPNNRRDVIRPTTGGGYVLETYRPKDDLDDKPRDRVEADKIPASEAGRYFEAGDFKRLTVVDIRGTWTPAEPTGKREYISIEGWGNAYRYPAADGGGGTDPGKWRLLNDRVVITWVDGSKDVIRIAFPEFVQESYGPGQEVTGQPGRTIEVVRSE